MSNLIYPEDGPQPHELFKATMIHDLAYSLCSVQPMTKEVIGDPTRGYENIFTIKLWSVKYEKKQNMLWEDDGGK